MTEAEAKKLAEDDAKLYGRGFCRHNADGEWEHIPVHEIMIHSKSVKGELHRRSPEQREADELGTREQFDEPE